MRDIIFMLSSHGWEKVVEESSDPDLSAIDRLTTRFTTPLQEAGATVEDIKVEIEYAVQYVAVSSLDYHSVWWILFHASSADEWSNVLVLAELLFSLPASNGKLEWVFSTLGTIKVDKRSRLSNQALDDMLLIKNNDIPLVKFSPDPCIDLWWQAKVRRPSQKKRKDYKKWHQSTQEQESSCELEDILENWDNLMNSDSNTDSD